MSKFECMEFSGGAKDEFVVHATKYTKEEAVECAKRNSFLYPDENYSVSSGFCRYYVRVPDWCAYDGDGEGCYSYCDSKANGSFPVWVITRAE